ncbi:MAG: hypothetical protein LC769_03920 [Chloroflexi bacterium]|nr:hypothetical protein [Chloroflexota bacterium]
MADKVAVVNTSRTSPLTVRLSISDGLTSPQGGGLAFNDTRTQRQIGRWVRLSVTTVTVPRYSITFVPMTVSLPSSVPPGQYEGAVNVTNVQATTISSGKAKFGVYLNRRCMVLLRVSGPPTVGLKVTHVGVARAAARTVLGLQLQNTGTVLDYPVATVLTVVGHGRTYTLHPGVGLVTGGTSTALAVPLDRAIAPGRYQVRVQLTYLVRPSPSESAQSYTLRWQGTVSVPQGKGH